MSDIFDAHAGDSPLIVSVPHDGRRLAPGMAERMTAAGLDLPDTDWHVGRLYEFVAGMGATVIAARYSRYVVDLNRPADDAALYEGQLSTGLCPSRTFGGGEIYQDGGALTATEQALRIRDYWQPYHDRLAQAVDDVRRRHGFAVLWDAHSIAAEVPSLFEGRLPDLNIGTNGGASCAAPCGEAIAEVAAGSGYSWVINGRFRGGYITRHYGTPSAGVHAIQLELAQRAYMDEDSREYESERASRLQDAIRRMLDAAVNSANGS